LFLCFQIKSNRYIINTKNIALRENKNLTQMKTSILLIFTIIFLASCKKDIEIIPKIPKITTSSSAAVVNADTIADHAAFKIKLVKDSINSDETMIIFNKASKTTYSADEDALYLMGYGQESLSSLSSDGRDLVFNNSPYTPGMSIRLDVKAQSDGPFSLQLSYQIKLPANLQVWLKDNYLKDSVDVRTTNYKFNVVKADTSSFGKNRFKLIIKEKAQQ
jgi:hypothetical protein